MRLFTFTLLISFATTLFAQESELIFVRNGTFTYFVGKAEPSVNWKDISFDDSGWKYADTAVIGYGWKKDKGFDEDVDSVVIEQTTSLYLRIKFNINDPSRVRDLNLDADYNDGYIAYLNGEEVARKNVDKSESQPYNQTANRSHKNTTYRDYHAPVNGVYIDSLKVKKLLKKGANVFAIHVVNDSPNGSDLSFLATLYNLRVCDRNYYYLYRFTKNFQQIPLDSSEFPIVIINTDEYGIPYITDDPRNIDAKVIARMSIINKKNKINKLSNGIDFTSRISIERRGETSKDFPKMCFNIETQDEYGNNMDTSIMGMPSDNDWILNSLYGDKTLVRNELTYTLAREMGHYTPRTQWCELILNGEYQGLYCFMEKIKRGKDRVNVAKRDSINPANGGYVFKYDKADDNDATVIQYVSPKPKDITQNEKNYLNNFIKNFKATLNSPNFLDPDKGYKKYISSRSLIDYVIINEIARNCDAYLFSTYLHKDKDSKDGRLKYGPLWDYDIAYRGAGWQGAGYVDGWQFYQGELQIPKLFMDTTITHELSRKWFMLRNSLLSEASLFDRIDSIANSIEKARLRNYQVWPILDKPYIWPVVPTYTYEDDINVVKNWLSQRMKWIDANINSIFFPYTGVSSITAQVLIDVYPNPFSESVTVKLLGGSGVYQVNIQNIDGKVLCRRSINTSGENFNELKFSANDLNLIKNGIYFLTIIKDGQIIQAKKIIKSY